MDHKCPGRAPRRLAGHRGWGSGTHTTLMTTAGPRRSEMRICGRLLCLMSVWDERRGSRGTRRTQESCSVSVNALTHSSSCSKASGPPLSQQDPLKTKTCLFYDGNFSLMCVILFFSTIVSCEKWGRFSFWAIHMLYKVYISECSLGYCLACCGFWIQETANSVQQCFGCFSALGEKGPWQQNIVCLLYTLWSPTRKPTFTLKACVLIHRWMNE